MNNQLNVTITLGGLTKSLSCELPENLYPNSVPVEHSPPRSELEPACGFAVGDEWVSRDGCVRRVIEEVTFSTVTYRITRQPKRATEAVQVFQRPATKTRPTDWLGVIRRDDLICWRNGALVYPGDGSADNEIASLRRQKDLQSAIISAQRREIAKLKELRDAQHYVIDDLKRIIRNLENQKI